MRTTSLFTTAAALALIAAPARAQQVSAIPTSSNSRIIATYAFRNAPQSAAFPRNVTVADSAGTIIARVEIGTEQASIPMTVTVIERNLVLQGETSEGLLTLVLDRQNEGGVTKLTSGSWTLGKAQGELRGRALP